MATVINTPGTAASSDSAAAGWAVAIIVLVAAVLIGLFIRPGIIRQSAAPSGTGSNINVTLPSTDSGTGGTQSTPSTGGQATPVTP